jgi:amino acid adenylation domain-containing protein
MVPFLHRLIHSLNNQKGETAFVINDKSYSYATLQQAVRSTGIYLAEQTSNEQRIGVLLDNSIETYASVLAILLSGKTYVPIHPGHPENKNIQIIIQAGLKTVLGNKNQAEEGAFNLVTIVQPEFKADADYEFKTDTNDQTEAYILFTSGTTGVPKGVPITYENIDAFLYAFFEIFNDLKPSDKFLQMFDLTFDLSVMSYLAPLCVGASVYTLPNTGVKYLNIYTTLEDQNITFALMVPSMIQLLQPYFEEINLPAMRYSLFCGEALLQSTVTQWQKCIPNAQIWNVYGPTEATIFCTAYHIANNKVKAYNDMVCIGHEMISTQCIIIDENQNEMADGEKGELCISGSQLTKGYLNNSEKNKEAFFEKDGIRFYKTGDICFRDLDGDFSYCGRSDHQVKLQGFRVELSEIEFYAKKCLQGVNTVAIVKTNDKKIDELHLFTEPTGTTDEQLLDLLKTSLPAYMIPQFIHRVNSFPLNANGKTDRKALSAQL